MSRLTPWNSLMSSLTGCSCYLSRYEQSLRDCSNCLLIRAPPLSSMKYSLVLFACCADYDECITDPCGGNATCINYDGSFGCECELGYTGDPYFSCTGKKQSYSQLYMLLAKRLNEEDVQITSISCSIDVNECLVNKGGCSSICENQVGSFACSCFKGFMLDTDDLNCIGMCPSEA